MDTESNYTLIKQLKKYIQTNCKPIYKKISSRLVISSKQERFINDLHTLILQYHTEWYTLLNNTGFLNELQSFTKGENYFLFQRTFE